MKRNLTLALALTTLVGLSSIAASAQETFFVRDGVTLNARSGPGTDHTRLAALTGGTQLTVLERSGNWGKVRLQNGRTMWVSLDYLTRSKGPERQERRATQMPARGDHVTGVYYVRSGVTLNGRAGPGTRHGRIAALPGGSRVTLLETSGSWGKVRNREERILWVALEYLTRS